MIWTVQALAERLGIPFRGNGDHTLVRVSSLAAADRQSLAFLARAAFKSQLADTAAGAVIVAPEYADSAPCAILLSDNPYATYARAAQLLHPAPEFPPGAQKGSVVDPSAVLAAGVHVGANAVVSEGASIGEGSVIGAGTVVGPHARIGARCRLAPNVTVTHDCVLGDRCRVQAGAVIGSDGFGFARDGEDWIAIPQTGRVLIGDDVEIGANTTIDRGSLEDTVIGNGAILDNQIQIAHNVRIGDHTAIAGCVGVAGSTHIGRRCTIGGAASIIGHLEIADDVNITAMSLVTKSITLPGTYSSGIPLQSNSDWRKSVVRFRQLDQLTRRVRDLESKTDNTES